MQRWFHFMLPIATYFGHLSIDSHQAFMLIMFEQNVRMLTKKERKIRKKKEREREEEEEEEEGEEEENDEEEKLHTTIYRTTGFLSWKNHYIFLP